MITRFMFLFIVKKICALTFTKYNVPIKDSCTSLLYEFVCMNFSRKK